MWAQQDQQEQRKPLQQQTKPSKPESKPSEGKTESGGEARTGPQQEEKRQPEDQNRARQEQQRQLENQQTHARHEQQKQTGEQQKQEQQRQATEQRKRAQDEVNDRNDDRREARAQAARPGGPQRGARIPDDRFREHFGHEHRFRVERVVLVENRPRFQYTGYWFELVDPWPAAWSYSDDCYIDYVDDEYFLFNPMHPGIRIAVVVVGGV